MKNLIYFIFTLYVINQGFVSTYGQEVTPQIALEAEKAGQHEKALQLFGKLANKGDSRAMIHIGNKYYSGDGVGVDYKKAFDWWLKAFSAKNGDAPGNIGVLFRDGKGVQKNRKIAYLLFLYTHMEGLGTESTQIRVNGHLRREVAELPQEEIMEALCYTWEYVVIYVQSRGELKTIPENVLPSAGKLRIKDNDWWLPDERQNLGFDCKSPWDNG